jgi:flagella basal body P-ring formation protein FlgA
MTNLALFAVAGCLAVGAATDRITLGDVAPAFPGWKPESPATALAYAPAPGVARVFRVSELLRIAARFHIPAAPAGDLCLERRVAPLDRERLLAAMRLSLPEARIEVLDYSHVPVPEGELEFPVSGLRETPAGEFWNGLLRYAGVRRFAVWAKVKVTVAASRVVAATDLAPFSRVAAGQLRVEIAEGFPAADAPAAIEAIAGRVTRRAIRAGTPLRESWFEGPRDVERGDIVRVEVSSGGTHLEMEGEAQAAGSTGQVIPVRNAASKKSFPARIEGKGRVSVVL